MNEPTPAVADAQHVAGLDTVSSHNAVSNPKTVSHPKTAQLDKSLPVDKSAPLTARPESSARPEIATAPGLLLGDLMVAETLETPACPVCRGRLVDMRGELVCSRCRTRCDSVSEGLPWNQAARALTAF
jgi:hypothetical protein